MTAGEKALQVITATLPACRGKTLQTAARLILDRLSEARITVATMVASPDLFTRFHAHCRYLGVHGGDGYQYWYNAAVNHAMEVGDWPCRIVQKTVDVDGQDITVDIEVPESTRCANNRQLLLAYSVITDAADEKGIVLPENLYDSISIR